MITILIHVLCLSYYIYFLTTGIAKVKEDNRRLLINIASFGLVYEFICSSYFWIRLING